MRIAAAVAVLALAAMAMQAQNSVKFNPEPLTGNRSLGISVGLVTKQLNMNGIKMPLMYLDRLLGNTSKKQSASLQVGLTWSPEFKYGVGIQTGVYYELSYENASSGPGFSTTLSDHTLSIPLRVQWRYEIVPDWSVFVYTGPSFDVGLAGNTKNYVDAIKEPVTNTAMYGSAYKRFNMLWGIGAGVRWKFLQLRVGGDWGMLNISTYDDEVTHINKPFHVTLSYMF